MPRNPGHLPPECVVTDDNGEAISFHHVHVKLFSGWSSRGAGHQPWPSAGCRPPTDWKISRKPHPFQIEEYELA